MRRGRGSVPRLRTDAWGIAMACRPPTTPDWTVVDGESALREDDALKWTALHMPIPDKPPSTTRRWRMQSLSPAPWLRWTTARCRRCKACGMGRRTVRPGRRPPGRVQQRLRSLAPFTLLRPGRPAERYLGQRPLRGGRSQRHHRAEQRRESVARVRHHATRAELGGSRGAGPLRGRGERRHDRTERRRIAERKRHRHCGSTHRGRLERRPVRGGRFLRRHHDYVQATMATAGNRPTRSRRLIR